jgi:dTDP-4-dehydrorhamnose 3,5-epimerase
MRSSSKAHNLRIKVTTMFEQTAISGVVVFTPRRFEDARGWFAETYSAAKSGDAFGHVSFIQDNQSLSRPAFTMRGLHFQTAPHAQDKLVRVLRGSVLDVAVDIRVGSPTYGQHVAVTLSAENMKQLFVPKGFAHAFMTLEDNCEVAYKVSDIYAPECEGGLLWRDPALGINWPVPHEKVVVVERDDSFPTLANLPAHFHF